MCDVVFVWIEIDGFDVVVGEDCSDCVIEFVEGDDEYLEKLVGIERVEFLLYRGCILKG